jgi:dihydrofolate reductase
MTIVSLMVAMDRNRVIGKDNQLPWHLPADLRRFKALTLGKPLLMGRKTFESIGRPLPGRENLVLSRNPNWQAAGVTVIHSLAAALLLTAQAAELVVIGGAAVFEMSLPHASRLYLTEVDAEVAGDTYFPQFDWPEAKVVEVQEHAVDAQHRYAMRFSILQRC